MQIQISWLLQLIWIYTVCKGRVYPDSAGQGLKQTYPNMYEYGRYSNFVVYSLDKKRIVYYIMDKNPYGKVSKFRPVIIQLIMNHYWELISKSWVHVHAFNSKVNFEVLTGVSVYVFKVKNKHIIMTVICPGVLYYVSGWSQTFLMTRDKSVSRNPVIWEDLLRVIKNVTLHYLSNNVFMRSMSI